MKLIGHRMERGHDVLRVRYLKWFLIPVEREFIRDGSYWYDYPSWRLSDPWHQIDLDALFRRLRWEASK